MQSILRSHCSVNIPEFDGTDIQEFCNSKQEEIECNLVLPSGESVPHRSTRVVRTPLSKDMLQHTGESCDMYELDNLNRAGVSLTPITNFYQPSIETVESVIDSATSVDINDLTQLSKTE